MAAPGVKLVVTSDAGSVLATIRIESFSHNGGTGFQFFAEGPQGDARFLEINYGGGHVDVHCPGSLPDGTTLELTSDDRSVVVHRP